MPSISFCAVGIGIYFCTDFQLTGAFDIRTMQGLQPQCHTVQCLQCQGTHQYFILRAAGNLNAVTQFQIDRLLLLQVDALCCFAQQNIGAQDHQRRD